MGAEAFTTFFSRNLSRRKQNFFRFSILVEINVCHVDDLERLMQQGYVELEDGWIAPGNGYQYKADLTNSTWEECRSICQGWGGDLIVYGFQDFSTKM